MIASYIILAVLTIIIALVYFVVNSGDSMISNMQVLLYLFLFGLGLAALGCMGLIDGVADSAWWFIALQALSLLVGCVYWYLLKIEKFGVFKRKELSEVMLVLLNGLLGSIGFIFVFNYFSKLDVAYLFAGAIIPFTLPYFFMYTFNILASIPPEIHSIWHFSLEADEPDFDKIDVTKIRLLEIEFNKTLNDTQATNYKVKAPLSLEFGDWYRSFINNYNYKFEDSPIEFLNPDNTPNGWIFYTKPSFFRAKRYIDPKLSIEKNKLTEKITIVAKRVAEHEE